MLGKIWHKYCGLPSVVEMGRSDYDALPSAMLPHSYPDGAYTWEDYDVEARRNFPIRYFLNRTVPEFFRPVRRLKRVLTDAVYWLKCHTLASHRFHMIDIRQPKGSYLTYRYGWIDSDYKMLYGMFAILCEYIEKEEPLDLRLQYTDAEIKSQGLEHQTETHDEAKALYRWWKVEREDNFNVVENMLKASEDESREENRARYKQYIQVRDEFDAKDTDMLIRLIKIRNSLWT